MRRQLLGTPGIADVSSFGGLLKQYEIALNTDKLRSYNLSIADVFNALEKTIKIPAVHILIKNRTLILSVAKGLLKQSLTLKKL